MPRGAIASRLANGLLVSGLRAGDRVGLLAYNCVEWMEMYVGLARAGLVAVPINFRLTGPEVGYVLEHAEPAAVIAGSEFTAMLDELRAGLPQAASRYFVIGDAAPAGWTRYEEVMAQGDPRARFAPVHPEATCALVYTSRAPPTSRPKGAIRSHACSSVIAFATVSVISQFDGPMIEVDDGRRGLIKHEKPLGRRKVGE